MSGTLGSAGDAQLASGQWGLALLVDLLFADGPLHLCTLPMQVEHIPTGTVYTGLGSQLSVEPIKSSEDASADTIKLSLPLTNDALLAGVVGNVANYRGREVRIWVQLFNDRWQPQGDRALEWRGYMDPVRVQRSRGDSGITGRIELPCTRAGLARARQRTGLRVTHAQQQARYPGDLGCEYVQALVEQPATWLSKRFQEI